VDVPPSPRCQSATGLSLVGDVAQSVSAPSPRDQTPAQSGSSKAGFSPYPRTAARMTFSFPAPSAVPRPQCEPRPSPSFLIARFKPNSSRFLKALLRLRTTSSTVASFPTLNLGYRSFSVARMVSFFVRSPFGVALYAFPCFLCELALFIPFQSHQEFPVAVDTGVSLVPGGTTALKLKLSPSPSVGRLFSLPLRCFFFS